jgi:2-C-methyl-D-erythritol 4-phosphate cytidylyltransferase
MSWFRFWAVVPAAGSARRMNRDTPKQYLSIASRPVIEWSIAPLLARAECAGVVVVLAEGDERWKHLSLARDSRIRTTVGGKERADSVLAGLAALSDQAQAEDWIAVHDAARPCLQDADLALLIDAVREDEVGGLLAVPVADTLKRADADGRVAQTVPRAGLWRAQTPQMFRYGLLTRALRQAAERSETVTDEAQAVEMLGLRPRLVLGSADNIKITVSEDLQRAERILKRRMAQ